ncbi:MAG: 16S rRNA (cytidine(1402)-2'-O)-methyltransferase [SAR202 cluster bacterium]|jgi:16S rRNA (cytidine1402-2'-O)-methyltransferase|nr:16S rRNA (cytidine(1402)-2'-O)-methyltransferase [SAR202 cluster bacterium]|tara:strand:- start:16019 stop:16846 length:828 start_codon:yes stop_codon:yes gene_type:complete
MGTLYIVGTPIGNLEDVSFRVIRILSEVDLIAAEDTRVTQKLLGRYDIKTKKTSFNKDNSPHKIPEILNILANNDVALTTDAGTPGISDPGYELVKAVDSAGFSVIGIPGPSAVTTVLSMCPFPLEGFIFTGFPPRKDVDLSKFLKHYGKLNLPLVLFESPRRLRNLLEKMTLIYSDRYVFIAREMTKIHEETFHGTPSDALAHFLEPKGEFTIVLSKTNIGTNLLDHSDILTLIQKLSSEGFGIKEISREIASVSNLGNSGAYKLILDTLVNEE